MKKNYVMLIILLAIFLAFVIFLETHHSPKQLERGDLIIKIETLAKDVREQYPATAGILFTLAGAMHTNDELDLFMITAKFSELMIEKYSDNKQI